MRSIAAIFLLLSLLAADDAIGRPPPYDEPAPVPVHRPAVEWSSWVRLGYGTTNGTTNGLGADAADAGVPRGMVMRPPSAEAGDQPIWDTALGADATIAIGSGGDLRLGAWGELRTTSRPVLGGELLIGASPAKLDMFQHNGEGVLVLRLGGNDDVLTAALAYGYRCAWALFGPWTGSTRYMIGARLVVSATRARADHDDWSATVGIEFEPLGSFRYLFGVRSWY